MLPEVGGRASKIKKPKFYLLAGGLGCLSYNIYTAGVGTIGIVDFDTIEIHNLHRQILYTEDQVGLSKAETAKAALHKLNPLIEVIAIPEKITIDNASTILNDYDIIVDGSDNFATRYLVNDTCVSLDKTLIYGSILGFEGVAVLIIERVKPARLIS
jgi:adenylyltransferase/sulfurtransferase